MVEPSSSALERDEEEKPKPNAEINNDPEIGNWSPETLDSEGRWKENTPLKVEKSSNNEILNDFDVPVPTLTFTVIELSETHRDDDDNDPDKSTITAESDMSQNWRP